MAAACRGGRAALLTDADAGEKASPLLRALREICASAPLALRFTPYFDELLQRSLARVFAAPPRSAERQAALILARRRRLGPFCVQEADRPLREKHIAAMLRAGHRLDVARAIISAESPEDAEAWVSEAGDD